MVLDTVLEFQGQGMVHYFVDMVSFNDNSSSPEHAWSPNIIRTIRRRAIMLVVYTV